MTEQPIERPRLREITHKRHGCKKPPMTAICGWLPSKDPTGTVGVEVVPEARLHEHQGCIVCESLWEDARVLGLVCGRCGEKIRP